MEINDLNEIPVEFREEYKMLYEASLKVHGELKDLEARRQSIILHATSQISWEISELKRKFDALSRAMDALHPKNAKEYNKDGGWKEKIIWVLRKSNTLIPVSTILSKIKIHEDNFREGMNGVIRTTINRMITQGELVEYINPGLSSKHYGLPDWFNEDGSLKSIYYF